MEKNSRERRECTGAEGTGTGGDAWRASSFVNGLLWQTDFGPRTLDFRPLVSEVRRRGLVAEMADSGEEHG